jgi:hypothetical protein
MAFKTNNTPRFVVTGSPRAMKIQAQELARSPSLLPGPNTGCLQILEKNFAK